VSRRWQLGIAAFFVAAGIWAWPSDRPLRARRTVVARLSDARAEQAVRADRPAELETGAGDAVAPAGAPDAPAVDDMRRNRTTETLLERLASTDQFLVIDAADGLRARKATVAIPKLAAIDVVANPDSARTVIDALGQLAGNARGAERAVAVDRLLALLEQEKRRGSPDAPGNVLQIYEALGKTEDARAAQALERELSDESVPLAALTVVTDSLVSLGQTSSRGPLAAARERVGARALDDAFEREIQAEVVAKIDHALAML